MKSAATLLVRMAAVRQTGASRWLARCPSHQDRRASLSVREVDGRVLVHCFAGCSAGDVVAALGLSLSDLFDKPLGHRVEPVAAQINAADALVALSLEAMVVVLVSEALRSGQKIDQEKRQRLDLAAGRIMQALNVVSIPESEAMRRIRRGETRISA